jgi:hypothetical protein
MEFGTSNKLAKNPQYFAASFNDGFFELDYPNGSILPIMEDKMIRSS